ncbi:MAG: sulfatase family protein [Woeseiaceae bacterium]
MKARKGAPSRGRLFFALTLLLALGLATSHARADDRPNIIVVMADDHAQWALGAYGLEQIDTPNIDWLADQGVRFENAMSPAPVCSAARASFYTGKMPSQHGVHDFLSENADFDANWLAGQTLLSERLQDAGYRTGLFGKWHATTDSKPPQPGFDRWLSYDPYKAGWENQYHHSGTVSFSNDGEDLSYTGVQARYLTEEAIRFIDDSADQPFFVSLNFTEPHAPFAGLPERLVARYRSLASDIVRAGASSDLADRGSRTTVPDDHVEQLAQYLAAVSLIDEQVGRLLDALQGRDLLDNTVLVYTSDHGLLMGQYGLYGKTNATNPANFYEETIRIPMIVHAPGRMRGGQSRGELVDLLDLHATIREFSLTETDDAESGPGHSLRLLLEGRRNINWRKLQMAERGNLRMVTDGRWKLVREYQRDERELPLDRWYDLTHPFGERHGVDLPSAAVRGRLMTELERFFSRYETAEHSGRLIWDQPPPNARMRDDLAAN